MNPCLNDIIFKVCTTLLEMRMSMQQKKMTVLLHIDWTTSEVLVISAISNGNVIIPKQQ